MKTVRRGVGGLIGWSVARLIVEDEPLNRMLLSRDVERHGRLVAAVADGRPGAGAELFDIVLLDVFMRKWPATRRSKCPEPDARLLTPYVELAHVDEVARRAQQGLASRIGNEN